MKTIKDGPTYKFCHDQIQQAAYSLIPEDARSSLHLLIARSLYKAASAEEMGTSLFVIVDQFNRGAVGIVDAEEKLQVATLNLRAAKKAIALSTFLAASIYLKLAICFLQEEDWQSNYTLCLEVYSSFAEVEYVAGTFEDMSLALNEVLEHGRCLDDKLRAFYTLVSAFAAQNDLKNAIKTGFDILAELGHPLEDTSDRAATERMVMETNDAVESKDQNFWSSLPRMSDARKIFTMKFLCLMTPYAFIGGGEKLPFIGCRMVQLTMADGLDHNSPYGFAVLAAVFCGFMRKPKEGYQIGKIGKMLLDSFNSRDSSYLARTHAVLYGFVNVWTEPLQASLPQLMIGHDNGLSSGDTECAARCATMYINNAFQSGLNLQTLLGQMNTFASEMRQYKQFMPLRLLTLYIQSVLNLIDVETNDPVLLTGEAMNEQSFLEEVTSKGIKMLLCQFHFRKIKHAYLFRRHDAAAEAIIKGREIKSASLLLPKFEGCVVLCER